MAGMHAAGLRVSTSSRNQYIAIPIRIHTSPDAKVYLGNDVSTQWEGRGPICVDIFRAQAGLQGNVDPEPDSVQAAQQSELMWKSSSM